MPNVVSTLQPLITRRPEGPNGQRNPQHRTIRRATHNIRERSNFFQEHLIQVNKYLTDLLQLCNIVNLAQNLSCTNNNYFNCNDSARVVYKLLQPNEPEYLEVMKHITGNMSVNRIVRVDNPALVKLYERKLLEKQSQFKTVTERWLFHGTNYINVHSICNNNFDYRLAGLNRGHKYGYGVCFATNATFACYYADQDASEKVVIMSKVLVGASCVGTSDMTMPPIGFDTTRNESGQVLVKYENDEFYPSYLIYFNWEANCYRDNYHL